MVDIQGERSCGCSYSYNRSNGDLGFLHFDSIEHFLSSCWRHYSSGVGREKVDKDAAIEEEDKGKEDEELMKNTLIRDDPEKCMDL